MKVVIKPGLTGNVITTVAIGNDYLKPWDQFASKNWKKYCEKHSLGLIVFDSSLVDINNSHWKKPNWQKLLIGSELSKEGLNINNVCYLDTDILINPNSPNIFDNYYDTSSIGMISQIKNLPYPCPISDINRRIAYLRNKYYSNKYPLDSLLFMPVEEIYKSHGLKSFTNYACTGVFLFNVGIHSDLMSNWFYKYEKGIQTLTGGGEEPHFNFEVQSYGKITWLDYRFQALWNYEMAWKYPFLYQNGKDKSEINRKCIQASLFTNYFLHFAGSWYESEMWEDDLIFNNSVYNEFDSFNEYSKIPVTGKPVGIKKP